MYLDEFPRITPFEEFQPKVEKMRVLEDWELESNKGSRRGSLGNLKRRASSIVGSLIGSKKDKEEGEADVEVGGRSSSKKKKKTEEKVKERL